MHWSLQLLLASVLGYVLAFVVSHWIILKTSPRQDRQLEAAMTFIFVFGPFGAMLSTLVVLGRLIF
jgi:hypothetical protein